MAADPHNVPDFKTRIAKALGDERLRGAVRYTADNLRTKRNAVVADLNEQAAKRMAIGSFAELRRQARRIKEHTLKHLDYYLEQAAERIRQNGGTVHWAGSAADVVRIAEEIAERRQAKRVIKSKSMASEEVMFNHALEAKGVEVVESDLGEYIIQLAHETPAHIVIPAIHKTRRQIADMFGAVAGRELTTDTPTLTKFARETLRKKFMAADIGVSGANFLVAESGTICLVTNEGNGRLTTSVPPVHVAIVGIEKLVPTLEDLAVVLGLLPRSATGQKITTYFNMITGPRRPGEPDGPEELHVIFLDNGRTNLLGSKYEEALMCIRCGACLNVCPVYRNIGGHAYGSIYPGPIGSVISPLLNDLGAWTDLPQASSLCGACHEACPMGIHLHEHLVSLRMDTVAMGKADPGFTRVMKLWMAAWRRPAIYRMAAKLGRVAMRPFVKKRADGTEVAESLPGPFAAWTNTRNFPPIASRTFHERWSDLEKEGKR
ncbi:LutB/LldF family L-lactate oxidation iron-sulfur protein [Symbiobacterium terraclitae]|uniref:LutB/LldF family L-lactate oxidation iron-sulfur protein n=1 Tax=Symbiobacterium terraclitae TaxID=557451 RepID=UPI0035B50E93